MLNRIFFETYLGLPGLQSKIVLDNGNRSRDVDDGDE